jgi:hypothetical protein
VRFRVEQRFEAALVAVEAALLDPGFLRRLGELPTLGAPELLGSEIDGHLVHQRVRYRFAGDLAPAVTAVIDPARLTWVEETTYDLVVHCGEHRIVPDHYGGRLTSSYSTHLAPSGHDASVTVRTTEGEVKVRFPLVGGKVEKAIVSGLTEHATLEAEVLAGWLAEQG